MRSVFKRGPEQRLGVGTAGSPVHAGDTSEVRSPPAWGGLGPQSAA